MVAINWNFVFIVVNLYHIIIIYEKRPVKMDDKNTELYQTLFKEMTPVEYLKISRCSMGNNKTRSKNYNTRYFSTRFVFGIQWNCGCACR